MPCRWKKQGFSSGDACVSSMTGKVDDPNAFCYGEAEGYRHADFEKIYKQFLNYTDGETRYFQWVTALNLDETQPYGLSRREQFQWIKRLANFMLWKQDSEAKYWKVEAGFPLESMNHNVYSERELELSARTLTGQMTNLNHKYQMKPVEIVASEYENGIVECVLRVPNTYHCPGCQKGKTLNETIEDGLIVNVSLEASCAYTSHDDGLCEGMHFTGLALLTKDVLPGIPLTRMMPLESIMVEALQSSTKTDRRQKKVKKIEMIVEDDEPEPCPEGEQRNPETGECEPKTTEQTEPCPEGQKRNADGECVPIEQVITPPDLTAPLAPAQRDLGPSVDPDENGQCPEGYRYNLVLNKCMRGEECPEGQHFDQASLQCIDDSPPAVETPEIAVGKTPAPAETLVTVDPEPGSDPHERPVPIPEGEEPTPKSTTLAKMPPEAGEEEKPEAPLTPSPLPPLQPPEPSETEPKPPHTCADGYHYDFDAVMCVPDAPIVEQVRRIKAEAKLLKEKEGVDAMHKYYENQLNMQIGHNRKIRADLKAQRRVYDKLNKIHENTITALSITQRDRDIWKDKRDKATGLRDDFQRQLEETKIELEGLKSKYHKVLGVNLDLSKKNTKSNEDYLGLHRKLEDTEDKLKRARINAKKTLKLRV